MTHFGVRETYLFKLPIYPFARENLKTINWFEAPAGLCIYTPCLYFFQLGVLHSLFLETFGNFHKHFPSLKRTMAKHPSEL